MKRLIFLFAIALLMPLVSLAQQWALVKVSVASMRTEGRHSAELSTQALMGTPLKILKQQGEWYYVQMPDGYKAYVPESLIEILSPDQMENWRNAHRVVVTAMQSAIMAEGTPVSDLVLGCILQSNGGRNGQTQVVTPDGRTGYVRTQDIADLDEWARQDFDADLIINVARQMLGMAYLWGGTSTKMADCSGFTKTCYFANAIILQRDASQQALYGTRINPSQWEKAQKGDLLFWGNSAGRVTHVGMYVNDGLCIHCSGMVKYNSIDPTDGRYIGRDLLSIRRIAGNIGTEGITPVIMHPWYFNPKK